MRTLCVILARSGSRGLPGKNTADACGRPLVGWSIAHAKAAATISRVTLSTDSDTIAQVGRDHGIGVILRPEELASDTATVDSAARHAVELAEANESTRFDAVVILYGNIPLRPDDLVDRAVEKLVSSGADSVQSICPVGKAHPFWMHRLGGDSGDRLEPYEPNDVYRRQDLPPAYLLDGGIIAVRRESLFKIVDGQPHAFLGDDRRAVVTEPGQVIDVDDEADLIVARAVLDQQQQCASTCQTTSIGARAIGVGCPAYVIAELGVNHDGRLDRALDLTDAAKQAGADAVKLQLFDANALLSAEAILAQYQQGTAADPSSLLGKLELTTDQIVKVADRARSLGLGFILTCFSIESVDTLRDLKPDAVKVASPDAVNLPLIHALAGLQLPLIISTGACEPNEIDATLDHLEAQHPEIRPVLLQCVSAYPVPVGQASIGGIDALRARCPLVGYSDHTQDLYTGMLAVARGSCVLEKHLTYDPTAPGPDHTASFSPTQFTEYTGLIRAAEAAIGPGKKAVLDCEQDVRKVSRQSVCATWDLEEGHVVERDDVTVKRPGTGVPAAELDRVVGRKLKQGVCKNRLIRDDDLG